MPQKHKESFLCIFKLSKDAKFYSLSVYKLLLISKLQINWNEIGRFCYIPLEVQNEHITIFKAIKQQKPNKASEAVLMHIKNAALRLLLGFGHLDPGKEGH